jgi:hypothetical protein
MQSLCRFDPDDVDCAFSGYFEETDFTFFFYCVPYLDDMLVKISLHEAFRRDTRFLAVFNDVFQGYWRGVTTGDGSIGPK